MEIMNIKMKTGILLISSLLVAILVSCNKTEDVFDFQWPVSNTSFIKISAGIDEQELPILEIVSKYVLEAIN